MEVARTKITLSALASARRKEATIAKRKINRIWKGDKSKAMHSHRNHRNRVLALAESTLVLTGVNIYSLHVFAESIPVITGLNTDAFHARNASFSIRMWLSIELILSTDTARERYIHNQNESEDRQWNSSASS
jgi:hypothetical protein